VQLAERSLHLLLSTAAQRRRVLVTDMARKAHPAGSAVGHTCVPGARPTTLTPRAALCQVSRQDGRLPTDGELTVRSVRLRRAAMVTVRGELDCASARLLADELGELLREGICRLTVDLAEMTFIDSTGLATLVSALRTARQKGGDVVLHSPRRCVRKVLAISGADRFFVLT
jgi:anti-sigma B factor antagonist